MERITKQRHVGPFWAIGGATLLLLLTLLSWNSVLAGPLNNVSPKDGDIEVYGRIDSFPAALIGTWVVDGVTYEADGSTQFKQEAGSFAVDKCVKVAYFPNTSPLTIREVETENDSDCDGGAQPKRPKHVTPETPGRFLHAHTGFNARPWRRNEGAGHCRAAFPTSGLIGTWVINGVEYLADGSTEFEPDDGPLSLALA